MPRHHDREAEINSAELKCGRMVQGWLVSTSVAYAKALHPRSRDPANKYAWGTEAGTGRPFSYLIYD